MLAARLVCTGGRGRWRVGLRVALLILAARLVCVRGGVGGVHEGSGRWS